MFVNLPIKLCILPTFQFQEQEGGIAFEGQHDFPVCLINPIQRATVVNSVQ